MLELQTNSESRNVMALPLRGDWAAAEAAARAQERERVSVHLRLSALDGPAEVVVPGRELPERVLTGVVPLLAVAAVPLWLQSNAGPAAAILGGCVCAAGVTLLAERARRMALGECAPDPHATLFPAPVWWLSLSVAAALVGFMLGGPVNPVALDGTHGLAAGTALLFTLAPAWWAAVRWERHAVARQRQQAQVQERARLEAELATVEIRIAQARNDAELAARYGLWSTGALIGSRRPSGVRPAAVAQA